MFRTATTQFGALAWNGTLYLWGNNWWGQLGQGVASADTAGVMGYSNNPLPVPGNYTYFTIAYLTTCALDQDRAIWCWGNDNYGILMQGYLIPNNPTTGWNGLKRPGRAVFPATCGADPKFRTIELGEGPSPVFAVGVTYSGVLFGWVSAAWRVRRRLDSSAHPRVPDCRAT